MLAGGKSTHPSQPPQRSSDRGLPLCRLGTEELGQKRSSPSATSMEELAKHSLEMELVLVAIIHGVVGALADGRRRKGAEDDTWVL